MVQRLPLRQTPLLEVPRKWGCQEVVRMRRGVQAGLEGRLLCQSGA